MKFLFSLFAFLLSIASLTAAAFAPAHQEHNARALVTGLEMVYIPDGFTAAQWKKKQQKEKEDTKKKKFGAYGPQGFKSRSMQSFQTDLEKGKAGHLMPVFNAKDKIKKGIIKQQDVPYMQRGGGASWDNSDVKGAKKMAWNDKDKNYVANPKQNPFDWTGRKERQDPKQTDKKAAPPQKKKLFGLF